MKFLTNLVGPHQVKHAIPIFERMYPGAIAEFVFDQSSAHGAFAKDAVSQSVDLGRSNNPNTTPTKDYEKVRVVVYLRGVQRGCAEEGERGSTPTG